MLTAPTVKKSNFKNPRWRTTAILKTVESPYLCDLVTDFDEIWHSDTYWPPASSVKISIFLKIQHGGGRHIEHHKNRDISATMKTYVQQTPSRCFATLRQLRSIRRCIPTSVFNPLVSALVLSRLDYCNSLLIDLPLTHIQRLQSVQNAAARLIFNLRRCHHIIDALISVHWLRVPERIIFKVATLTYRALYGSACTTLLGVVIHMCH